MHRVEQRQFEKGDCGVACVAMITGRPYEEIERAFQKQGLISKGQYYTFHEDLIAILESFGWQAQRREFSTWQSVQYPAIVKVNVRAGNYWHWVVLAGERQVLDPKPGAPEVITDYRGCKAEGQYLHVVRKP